MDKNLEKILEDLKLIGEDLSGIELLKAVDSCIENSYSSIILVNLCQTDPERYKEEDNCYNVYIKSKLNIR